MPWLITEEWCGEVVGQELCPSKEEAEKRKEEILSKPNPYDKEWGKGSSVNVSEIKWSVTPKVWIVKTTIIDCTGESLDISLFACPTQEKAAKEVYRLMGIKGNNKNYWIVPLYLKS
jgi:hypothetical protein